MPNFKDDIEKAAGDERIEAIVIGRYRGDRYYGDPGDAPNETPEGLYGVPITWERAAPILDYSYDDGYGGEDCHAVYAYTPRHILFVQCYDGSTSVTAIPRLPTSGQPHMVGGG